MYAEHNPTRAFSRHDLEGRFRLEGLAPSSYAVLVDPEVSGYEEIVVDGIEVPSSRPIEIRVGRGAMSRVA